ncbi:MAG: glycosyltransferase, partial [Candidatus Binatia bacterium]
LNRSTVAAAAAHGLPIVTTKGQILEAPFIDQANMLLCPPNDPESIAAAVESLITNPELRSQLGAGALQLAREWFSWDKAVDRTIELLGLQQLASESGNVRGSTLDVRESLGLRVDCREHQGVRCSTLSTLNPKPDLTPKT